jgi:large subunit ribosomal protein L7/L12
VGSTPIIPTKLNEMRFTNKINEKMATNPKLFEIADTLTKLTVLEAKQLIDILEKDYGIKGAQNIVQKSVTTEENKVAVVEQTEFNVYLKEIGNQKLQVIKKVKEITNSGLKEAKDLVDSAPCLLREKVSKADAEIIRTELQNLFAVVEIK